MLIEYLMCNACSVLAALWLDRMLAEPARFHPLVGFGWYASQVERYCRRLTISERLQGVIAWWLCLLPPLIVLLALLLLALFIGSVSYWLLQTVVLYLAIGGQSLLQHATRVAKPLEAGNQTQARQQIAMMVSRNTEQMSESDIVSATIESVLENGNDAVIAPLFWFVLVGAPGALILRLANTLDAMWGYRNPRYLQFGWFSAKADDQLAWAPARLSALLYGAQGNRRLAWRCWQEQALHCKSPNGGVAMSAGAGALAIQIGGPAYYHGELQEKPLLGAGNRARAVDIVRACRLVRRSSSLFAYSYLLLVCIGWTLWS